jgi:hypothetical protein
MQELHAVVDKKVAAMIESGEIEKSIELGIEKSINESIRRQFESYGNITEQLNKLLDEKLKIDPSQIDIPTYNDVMLKAVEQKIAEFFESKAAAKLMEGMNKLFAPLPESMDIHEFINKIVAHWKAEDHYDIDNTDEYATVELKESEHSIGGYRLDLWKQRESGYITKRENSPEVSLYIGKDGDIRLRHTWNPTTLYGEDSLIIKAYASSMTLTGLADFDEDDCELCLHPDEDY